MSAGAGSPAGLASGVVRPALAAFAVMWFAYFASVALFNTYAPLWFKSLGLSTLAIGALSALQSWTRVLAPYAWSWAADHSGRRVALIRAAAGGALLAAAGLWLVQQVGGGTALVAVLVGLLFIANGGVVPLAEAALAQLLATPGGIDAGRYGRVRMWGSIGFIASVGASGLVLQGLGIAVFPPAVLLLNGALLATAWRLPLGHETPHAGEAPPPIWPTLRRPAVAWFFASVFFTVLAHVSLYAFFSLHLDALGHGKATVGALWAVAVGCEVLFFWMQGRWLGRMAPLRWLQLVAAVAVVRFVLTAWAGASLPLLVLAQATHAITFAAHHAACIALISRHFPGRLRGRGQALYSALGYGLSGLAGGLAGGWLIERAGFAAVFWAAAVAALLGGLCAWRAARQP